MVKYVHGEIGELWRTLNRKRELGKKGKEKWWNGVRLGGGERSDRISSLGNK